MSNLLRRLLGMENKVDLALQARAEQSERLLESERQEYRQTIQLVDSGVRVLRTWDSANRMMSRGLE